MKKIKMQFVGLIVIWILVSIACGFQFNGQDAEVSEYTNTPVVPTQVANTPTSEPMATTTPTPQPTNLGGGSGEIVFTTNRTNELLFDDDIYLLNIEGGEPKRLTDFKYSHSPIWSPDGEKILFYVEDESGSFFDIFVMNADGSELINLTDEFRGGSNASWSPDGKQIIFDSYSGTTDDIYIINRDGMGIQNLTNSDFNDRTPSISPDGQRIAFSRSKVNAPYSQIYVMDRDGSNVSQIAEKGYYPIWSPDGNFIAYRFEIRDVRSEVHVMKSDGSEDKNVSGEFNAFGYTWSPDSKTIAFISSKQVIKPTKTPDVGPCGTPWSITIPEYERFIHVVNFDGSELRTIFELENGGGTLSWSPDGNWIAFDFRVDTNNDIYIIRIDGTDLQRLTDYEGNDLNPDWRP